MMNPMINPRTGKKYTMKEKLAMEAEKEQLKRMSNHSHYGEPLYWEQRYEFEKKGQMEAGLKLFDFYAPFDKLYPIVESVMDLTIKHKILMIGVGKSNAVEFFNSKGFSDIVAIDISPFIVSQMAYKYSDFSGIEFLVLDARDLSYFPDETFTIVFDKGCMDATFCCTDYTTETQRLYKEIFRVLKPDGQFLSISHASPPSRVPYLRSIRWAIETCGVPEGENLTLYICLKTTKIELLNKRLDGAEAATLTKNMNVVSSMDQTMNKKSMTRNKENSGQLTVSTDVDVIAELVRECGDATAFSASELN
jgi:EEF1A lysine methyltransferase 4